MSNKTPIIQLLECPILFNIFIQRSHNERLLLQICIIILPGCERMAMVPNGAETLPKISAGWVGCTNVTDRQTDLRWQIANVNVSLRSLKVTKH